MAAGKIQQDVVIKTTGVKELKEAEQLVENIDGTKTTATVEVAVEGARDLDRFMAQLDGLSTERKTVVLALEAANVQLELNDISEELQKLAGTDVDITAKIANANQLEGDLDKLKNKITQINDLPIQPGGGRGLDQLDASVKTADASANVLANTIGNTAQDLGQMAGLAGTAGVAIGQLAEEMAAAAATGVGLRAALASFAAVAAPIAALVAGVQLVTSVLRAHQQAAKDAAEATDQLGEAMDSANNPALGLVDNMDAVVERLEKFDTMDPGIWTDFAHGVQDFAGSVPGLGSALRLIGVDVDNMVGSIGDAMPILEKAGINAFDIGQAIAGTSTQWSTDLAKAREEGLITAEQWGLAWQAVQRQIELAAEAGRNDDFFKVSLKQLQAMNDELAQTANPLSFFSDKWKILMEDMRDGTIDTQAAADAFIFLSEHLPVDVLKVASDELGRSQREAAKAAEEQARAQEKANEALRDASIATDNARAALLDLAGVFTQMEIRGDALRSAFDLGNAPLDAFEATKKLESGMRDLKKFIRDDLHGKLPNIFDPNDINAEPFLNKVASIREAIQSKVVEAFSAGGAPAADQTARAYIQQLQATFGTQITAGQWEALIFPGGITADIKIAVDQASAEEARRELEILTGVGGQTPWTASLQLALDAGQLTPNQARLIAQQQLGNLGVDIPASITVQQPTTADLAVATQWMKDHPVGMLTNTTPPTNTQMGGTRTIAQTYFDNHGVTIPVTTFFQPPPILPRWMLPGHDAGGTAGQIGGVAGEIGPEILNDRYLTMGPTYVPPGTRVTSRRKTARILRTSRAASLRRFDTGGTVQPITVQPIINVNAAVIGNRFDVMRAVQRAQLDKVRLLGLRG